MLDQRLNQQGEIMSGDELRTRCQIIGEFKMLYLKLFHGRIDPAQDMDEWGSDGPAFGPYEYIHTTYGHHLKLGKPDDDRCELFVAEDMLYYDGVYYGDWSVFDERTLKKGKYQTVVFEQHKANLPQSE